MIELGEMAPELYLAPVWMDWAISRGHCLLLKLFLTLGQWHMESAADVMRPLQLAAFTDQREVLKILLRHLKALQGPKTIGKSSLGVL